MTHTTPANPRNNKAPTGDKPGSAMPAPDLPGTGPVTSSGPPPAAREIGGQAGPEPTRYGDWEKNGRCTDF